MIDLKWKIPGRGFEWEVNRSPLPGISRIPWSLPGPWLVTKEKTNSPGCAFYQVADEPALFKKFAELGSSEEAILEFANAFGRLNCEDVDIPKIPHGLVGNERVVLPAENIDWWRRDIKDIGHAVSWWERTRELDDGWLKQFKMADPLHPNLILELPGSGSSVEVEIAARPNSKGMTANVDVDPIVEAGWEALIQTLNRQAQQCHLHIRLEHDPRSRKKWNTRREPKLVQIMEPTNLISALWLQFGLAVYAKKDFELCELCSRWFEPASQRRGGAKYCSDACRSRAFRVRKTTVLELCKTGIPAEEIARRSDRDEKQVEGWVKRMKLKRRRRVVIKRPTPPGADIGGS